MQKTAYELRISDWSSDVCSSYLPVAAARPTLLPPENPRFPSFRMTRLPGPAADHSRRKSRVPSSDALSTTMISRLRQLLSTARLCRPARVHALMLQARTMQLTRGSARLRLAPPPPLPGTAPG